MWFGGLDGDGRSTAGCTPMKLGGSKNPKTQKTDAMFKGGVGAGGKCLALFVISI